MAAGGAEGSAQSDLRTPFQDGDDHDVGDADAADQQGDGAEAEEQAAVGALGGDLGREDVGGEDVPSRSVGLAGLTVAGSTAATAVTWLGTAADVQLGGMAIEGEVLLGDGEADEGHGVQLGQQRHGAQDADDGEPVPADPHLGGRGEVADAEEDGGLGAEDDRGVASGGGVEERAVGECGAEGGGQGRAGGGEGDAVGVDGRDERVR